MMIFEKIRNKSKFFVIINFFLNALIIAFSFLLLLIVVVSFQTVFLGKEYNNFFGYSFFEVETGSMAGTIEIGDWIVVKLDTDYKLNDIVTYVENDSFVTHRIVELYKDYYVTKGDANNSNDNPIKKDAIIGKVIKIFPKLGFIEKIILNPKFIVFFLILLSLLCNIVTEKDSKITIFSKKRKKIEALAKEPKIVERTNEISCSEQSLEFAKSVFQNMKDEDVCGAKTVILSNIKVDLDIPSLENYKEDN